MGFAPATFKEFVAHPMSAIVAIMIVGFGVFYKDVQKVNLKNDEACVKDKAVKAERIRVLEGDVKELTDKIIAITTSGI